MAKRTHTMMRALLGGALMLGALSLPATGLAGDKAKMVIQVSDSDPGKWNLALNNAKNIQKDVGKDNVDLEIVAYGPGIAMLKAESEVANRVDEAVESLARVRVLHRRHDPQLVCRVQVLEVQSGAIAQACRIERRAVER